MGESLIIPAKISEEMVYQPLKIKPSMVITTATSSKRKNFCVYSDFSLYSSGFWRETEATGHVYTYEGKDTDTDKDVSLL